MEHHNVRAFYDEQAKIRDLKRESIPRVPRPATADGLLRGDRRRRIEAMRDDKMLADAIAETWDLT